jgi:hypothetical protein
VGRADVEFEDKLVAGFLLKGLGRNKYEGLVSSLERDEQSLNASAVKAKLLLEEKREEAERETYEERKRNELDQNKALVVKTPVYQPDYKRPGFQTSRSSWRKGEASSKIQKGGVQKEGKCVCFKCEHIGHVAKCCTATVDKKITPNNVQSCCCCEGFGHV